jgi:hypothetical protein
VPVEPSCEIGGTAAQRGGAAGDGPAKRADRRARPMVVVIGVPGGDGEAMLRGLSGALAVLLDGEVSKMEWMHDA